MADNRREVGDGEVTEKYPIRDDSAPEELATGEKIPKGLPHRLLDDPDLLEKMYEILKEYQPFYAGREKYYHNFNHATWVVEQGLVILDDYHSGSSIRDAYTHAMACHDAGHLNGLQKSDIENVDIALGIYENHKTGQDPEGRAISHLIIDATCFPHTALEEIMKKMPPTKQINLMEVENAIKVAWDVDRLGISMENEEQREITLIGFMREKLQAQTKEDILKSYRDLTNDFYDKLRSSFHTDYAREWAEDNLEAMRQWQLDFTPRAVEMAENSKNSA